MDSQIQENACHQDHHVVSPGQVKECRLMQIRFRQCIQLHMTCCIPPMLCLVQCCQGVCRSLQRRLLLRSMLATVPSCGATTGISIFIASTITMLSPAFTACPTDASIFTTLPGTEAVTFTEPARCRSLRCCFRCSLGSSLRCCFRCSCRSSGSVTLFNSYVICGSINSDCISFH